MRTLSRVLFTLIALILVASTLFFAYGFYSYRRPLPQTEGAVLVPGLQERVTVYRDDWGVPHIYAATTHDLFLTQGYIHAQDRWWQMEMSRHLGQGRVSEILGEGEAIQQFDRLARTLSWPEIAQAMWDQTTPEAQAALEAYAAGVNAYIAERSQGELAMQYTMLDLTGRGFEVEPWEPLDSLAWAVVLAWTQDGNLVEELTAAQLYAQFPADLLQEYLALDVIDPAAPTIIQADELGDLEKEPVAPLMSAVDYTQLDLTLIADVINLPYLNPQTGSGGNSWVVSGERTISGLPLLASDPNMGVNLPSLWYSNGLHCIQITAECPYNVVGDSFAGLPAIVAGHNAAIAWSLINAGIDVQDLQVVQLNPADLRPRTATILINDAEPLEFPIYTTEAGIILSTGLEGDLLALQWAAPGDLIGALLQINRAANWGDFRAALATWTWSSQHFLYADVEGNIGYQMAGQVPLRAHSGLLPVPGNDPAYQWQGFLPYDLLPSLYNPQRGWIMLTGQDAVPPAYWAWVSQHLDQPVQVINPWRYAARAQRLEDLLTHVNIHTVDSFSEIQGDTLTPFGSTIKELAASLDFSLPEEATYLDYQQWFTAWDQFSHADSPEAALFGAFWAHLVQRVFADEFPSQGLNRARQAILTLPPDHPWWDDQTTPEIIENREQTIRTAFTQAIDELSGRLGADREQWRWGDLHTTRFISQPFGETALGEIVNLSATGLGGDLDSIHAAAWSTAAENRYQVVSQPAFRQIIDLGNFENSRHIHAPGQSGHPASPHYGDMIDLWSSVEYHSMHWLPETVQATATSTLRLRPAPPDAP